MKDEITGWKKRLDALQHENVHLKNQLSEVLKDDISSVVLETAEYFQNIFIREDETVKKLKEELNQMLGLLSSAKESEISKFAAIRGKLKDKIESNQQHFQELKLKFQEYLRTAQ
ncbi:MAG: hypothetical protein K1X47_07895 [Cyclobacteriaceae bacterium]|nr:hypothetical protein [Cyclobacteriaceae bacterium]